MVFLNEWRLPSLSLNLSVKEISMTTNIEINKPSKNLRNLFGWIYLQHTHILFVLLLIKDYPVANKHTDELPKRLPVRYASCYLTWRF